MVFCCILRVMRPVLDVSGGIASAERPGTFQHDGVEGLLSSGAFLSVWVIRAIYVWIGMKKRKRRVEAFWHTAVLLLGFGLCSCAWVCSPRLTLDALQIRYSDKVKESMSKSFNLTYPLCSICLQMELLPLLAGVDLQMFCNPAVHFLFCCDLRANVVELAN